MVNILLATKLDLANPVHLLNWFANCLLLYFINLEYAVLAFPTVHKHAERYALHGCIRRSA